MSELENRVKNTPAKRIPYQRDLLLDDKRETEVSFYVDQRSGSNEICSYCFTALHEQQNSFALMLAWMAFLYQGTLFGQFCEGIDRFSSFFGTAAQVNELFGGFQLFDRIDFLPLATFFLAPLVLVLKKDSAYVLRCDFMLFESFGNFLG